MPETNPPQVFREDIFSLKEGEIVIRYPATMSQEEFADVHLFMEIVMRKIGRQKKNTTEAINEA
jgi:hypothetical protein